MDFTQLEIISPKRVRSRPSGWDAFFPYYAGFPTAFATALLKSAELDPNARVYDPWNGSGTTTFAANELSLDAVGVDLNPVMFLVARARTLSPTEADCLMPLTNEILKMFVLQHDLNDDEPLCSWFDCESAARIRALELSIRTILVGDLVKPEGSGKIERISSVAAIFYTCLFSVARSTTSSFHSTNPTWLKSAKSAGERVHVSAEKLATDFRHRMMSIFECLSRLRRPPDTTTPNLLVGDSSDSCVPDSSVSFVLTSPPYCTRIDYAAATIVELAILSPLLEISVNEIRSRMLGSIKVPSNQIKPIIEWGFTCNSFLGKVASHTSKASSGYYSKVHLDYFDKYYRSIASISKSLDKSGIAVFVVQDSYYKEIHNDLTRITVEMARNVDLSLKREERFSISRTIADSHPRAHRYVRPRGATEAVLCFLKG